MKDIEKLIHDISTKHPKVKETCREQKYAYNRFIFWKWLQDNCRLTLTEIASLTKFDKPQPWNHATVINGIRKATNMIDNKDPVFRKLTLDLGMYLSPDIYDVTQIEELDRKLKMTDKIRESLYHRGVKVESDFDIVGQIGDQVMTFDGMIKFINDLK